MRHRPGRGDVRHRAGRRRRATSPRDALSRRLARAALGPVTVVFGGLTLTGFAGAAAWPADLANHFRVQYAVILGVTALGAALARSPLLATAALVLGLANLTVVSPPWDERERPDGGRPELTLLVLNLDATNDQHAAVAELLGTRKPDVFAVLELTPAWARGLTEAVAPYRFRHAEIREGSYGLGIFSRRPLTESVTLYPAGRTYPVPVATVEGRTQPVRLALVHPRVPATSADARAHLTVLEAAARAVARAPGAAALIGDLNSTPWSARFRDVLETAGLEDTRDGYGLEATWPTMLPGFLRIPIDHVLATPGLGAVDREVGRDVGSDHLPVWVELARLE